MRRDDWVGWIVIFASFESLHNAVQLNETLCFEDAVSTVIALLVAHDLIRRKSQQLTVCVALPVSDHVQKDTQTRTGSDCCCQQCTINSMTHRQAAHCDSKAPDFKIYGCVYSTSEIDSMSQALPLISWSMSWTPDMCRKGASKQACHGLLVRNWLWQKPAERMSDLGVLWINAKWQKCLSCWSWQWLNPVGNASKCYSVQRPTPSWSRSCAFQGAHSSLAHNALGSLDLVFKRQTLPGQVCCLGRWQ